VKVDDSRMSQLLLEVSKIDRKMLLQRAKAFAGVMPQGSDRLNLSFRGSDAHASLRLYTPGEVENEITDDEFGVYREFPADKNIDTANPPEVELAISREFLASTLDQMEGTVIAWSYCKRMVLIEDEEIEEEIDEEEGGALEEVAEAPLEENPIKKSVLLAVHTIEEFKELELKAKTAEAEAQKKAEEEAKKKKAKKDTKTDPKTEVKTTEEAKTPEPAKT